MGEVLSFPNTHTQDETRFAKIFFRIFFAIYAFGPIATLAGSCLQNKFLFKAGASCFIATHLFLIVGYCIVDSRPRKRRRQSIPSPDPS